MVVLLLFLILLVIAWPIFAIFGGTLFVVLGSHLHIIVPTVLLVTVYLALLAPVAKKYNIKLGGKYGEALDPSRPAGVPVDEAAPKPKLTAAQLADSWKIPPRE